MYAMSGCNKQSVRLCCRVGGEYGWFPQGPPHALTQAKALGTRELVHIVQDDSSELSHTQEVLVQLLGGSPAWEQLDVRLHVRALLVTLCLFLLVGSTPVV